MGNEKEYMKGGIQPIEVLLFKYLFPVNEATKKPDLPGILP